MRVRVKDGRLEVSSFFGLRTKLACAPRDVTDVAIMADHDHYGLRALPWRSDHGELRLRYVFLWSIRDVTLDAFRDTGVESAMDWLRAAGWDIDAAVRESLDTPLIRVVVSKPK